MGQCLTLANLLVESGVEVKYNVDFILKLAPELRRYYHRRAIAVSLLEERAIAVSQLEEQLGSHLADKRIIR